MHMTSPFSNPKIRVSEPPKYMFSGLEYGVVFGFRKPRFHH